MTTIVKPKTGKNEIEWCIEQYQSGNDDSFAVIYKYYSKLAKAIANSYYIMGADKQDLIQEGFIGLYKAARDYKITSNLSFKSFAEICIRRQIITAVKTSTRQKHKPLNYCKSFNQPISSNVESRTIENTIKSVKFNPENLVIENENISELKKIIREHLSPFERSVFTLYSKGYSYKEIALFLDVNYKQVDTAIWRFKRKIKSLKKDELS